MAEDTTSIYALVVVALVSVVGLGLAVASFTTNESMTGMMNRGGSGMMGSPSGTTSAPGAFEWVILILSAAFLVLAVFLLLRGRASHVPRDTAPPISPPQAAPPVPAVPPETPMPSPTPPATSPILAEPTLVKLLDEDERRMYLEIRGHGGEMLQRDLVALGIFSKAKVTRVLDKLEAKGVVVREAHGMTNRVRLLGATPR